MTAAGCADGTEVVLVRINGGGHTWPAGRFTAGQHRRADDVCRGRLAGQRRVLRRPASLIEAVVPRRLPVE